MGLILFVLILQLASLDSLAQLDPEHATLAALESIEEATTWLILAQKGKDKARIAIDLPRARLALAGRGSDSRGWTGFVSSTLPGSVSITAGHLRASFGSGMILASPRFGTPETSGMANSLRRPRLSGYVGTNTERRIRGLAVVRDTGAIFAGAFGAGHSRGAALELRRSSGAVGAMAARTASGRTKTEGWLRIRYGQVGLELAGSEGSAIGAVKLAGSRGGPSLRLSARRYKALGSHAAPLRLRSGRGAAEHGLTLAVRWPVGDARIALAVDHSLGVDDVQDRTRASIVSSSTEIRIDRRVRADRLTAASETPPGSEEWRIFASHRLSGTPSAILSGFYGAENDLTASYLRLQTQLTGKAGWHLELGLVEFRARSGGPVLAVYEPTSEGAFPIVRLSGNGRRVSARVTRAGKRTRARLTCAWHWVRAKDALQGPVTSSTCSLSLSG